MSRTLLIYLNGSPDGANWAVFDDPTRRLVQRGSVPGGQALEFTDGVPVDRTWVLVPGADVVTKTVEVPSVSTSRMQAMLSFLLEDDIAVDHSDIHFAHTKLSSGKRLVAYTAVDRMMGWLTALSALGVTANLITPDFMVLPVAEGGVTIGTHAGMTSARLPNGSGVSIEEDIFALLAEDLIPDGMPIHAQTAGVERVLPGDFKASGRITCAYKDVERDWMELAYASLSGGPYLNLRQGKFELRRPWMPPGVEWKRVASLAGGVVAAALAVQIAGGLRMNNEAEVAYQRADAIFREVMPPGARLVNARSQLRARADELSATNSDVFLRVSTLVYAGVSDTDGVAVASLRFDGARGAMNASLSAPSFEAVEQIKRAISVAGGVVEEGGSRQQDSRVTVDLSVRLR